MKLSSVSLSERKVKPQFRVETAPRCFVVCNRLWILDEVGELVEDAELGGGGVSGGGSVGGGQGGGWGGGIPISLRREVLSLLSWGGWGRLLAEDAACDQLLRRQRLLAREDGVNLLGRGRLRRGGLWPLEVASLLGRSRLGKGVEVNLLCRGRLRQGGMWP